MRQGAAALPLAVLAALGMMACTSITIVDREGNTRIERSFGFASVELHPGSEAVLAEITALGYHGGPLGISLGFHHADIAALPDAAACRLIVWPRDSEDVARLKQLLGDTPGLCVVAQPSPKENRP